MFTVERGNHPIFGFGVGEGNEGGGPLLEGKATVRGGGDCLAESSWAQ